MAKNNNSIEQNLQELRTIVENYQKTNTGEDMVSVEFDIDDEQYDEIKLISDYLGVEPEVYMSAIICDYLHKNVE